MDPKRFAWTVPLLGTSEPPPHSDLTKGRYVYDFGDTAVTTPMMTMYTLGHT